MAQDSDALAHGLIVSLMPIIGEGGFSWSDYVNLDPRYDFTDLTQMYTSLAMELDGTNWAEIDSAAATAYPISAGCWVKSSTTAEQTALWIGNKDSADEWMRIGIDSSGNAFLGRIASGGGEDVTVGANIDDGSWHFIMAVCTSATNVDLYVDAVAAVNDTTSVVFANFDRTSVGRNAHSGTPDAYFIGAVDNVLVFETTALTSDQVSWIQTNKPDFDTLGSSTDSDNPGTTNCAMANGLDEFTGTRMDESGNGLHLVPGGNAAGVKFERDDSEYATSATTPVTTPVMSITGSFKTSTLSTNQGILAVGNTPSPTSDMRAVWLRGSDDKILAYAVNSAGNSSAVSASTVSSDTWHFFAALFDTSSPYQSLYFDDEAVVEETTERAPDAAYTKIGMGTTNPSVSANASDGTHDNIGLWTVKLSAANAAWLRTGNASGGPATYNDIVYSNHADNPGTSVLGSFWKLNDDDPSAVGTLVNVHNPGTHDLTTASGGAGPVSATGTVTDLPIGVAGTVTATAEVEDRALEFDGTTQYGVNTSDVKQTGDFAISCWVRPSDLASGVAKYGRGIARAHYGDVTGQWQLGVRPNGIVVFGIWENDGSDTDGLHLTASGVVADGNLYHLVVTRDTGVLALYVNGVSTSFASTDSTDSGWGNTGLELGRHWTTSPDYFWKGIIDEFCIFDESVDTTDVLELYVDGVGLLAADLVSGASALTSGLIPYHAWNLSKNNAGGAGEDVGSTGGIDLTLTNAPTDAPGIPAGQSELGLVSLVDNAQNTGTIQLTQATLSKRLEAVTVDEGNATVALRANGIDNLLQTAAFTAKTQPTSIFVVVKVTDQSADQTLVDGIGAANEHALQVNSTGDFARADAGTADSSALGIDYGTVHVWLIEFSGASTVIYRDGGAGETLSAGAESITGITIGTLYDGSSEPAAADYLYYLLNDGAFTDAEKNAIGGEIADLVGTTWTAVS